MTTEAAAEESKVVLSLEEQELQAAQAELAAEQDPEAKAAADAKAKEEGDAKAKLEADAKTEADAKAKADAEALTGKPAVKMVPVDALYKERKARQELQHQNAVLTGQVQALSHVVANKGEPAQEQQPQQTADERHAEIEAERLELAKKFDAAEISATEMRTREIELDREQRAMTLRQAAEAAQAAAPQAVPATDLQLEEATAKLGTDFPIINVLTAAQFTPFEARAYADAEAEGKPIQPGARGTLELRTRMAALATDHYGKVLGINLKAPAAAPSTPAKPAALSPQAQARETKIAAQAGFPPNVSQMGSAANGEGMTDAQFEAQLDNPNLTPAQEEALLKSMPSSVRRAFGGA